MSSAIVAAQRRRNCLLASTFLGLILALSISAAEAQQSASNPLPAIEISSPEDQTRTRAKPMIEEGSGSRTTNDQPKHRASARPERIARQCRAGCQAVQRHRRRIRDRHHVRRYRALSGSNRAGNHRPDSRRATDDLVRRRKWREDQYRPPRIRRVRHLQHPPPHQWTPGQ